MALDELQKSCKTTYDDLVINPIGIGMGMPEGLSGLEEKALRKVQERERLGE